MTKKEAVSRLEKAVREYLQNEQALGDTTFLTVDPQSGAVSLETDPDVAENSPYDYYEVMDFVTMSPDGKWLVDREAIDSVAEEMAESSDD